MNQDQILYMILIFIFVNYKSFSNYTEFGFYRPEEDEINE